MTEPHKKFEIIWPDPMHQPKVDSQVQVKYPNKNPLGYKWRVCEIKDTFNQNNISDGLKGSNSFPFQTKKKMVVARSKKWQ